MAIPKLIQLLDRGKEAWNDWREQRPDITPDLRAAMAPYAFDLRDRDLSGMNFSRMDFQEVRIAKTHFLGTNFQNANLSRAILSTSVFRHTDFSNANLSEAQLFGTHFLDETNLVRTNFNWAKLNGARFTGARLGWTIFGGNDLSNVYGLDEVRIEGPITIGFDSVFLSQGGIPTAFLKKAQMKDEAITFIQSAAKNPVKYHSCFISYSTRNQKPADQLRTHLINEGVDCFLATEDLRGGENFAEKIAEAIRRYDRLVVLISKQSLESRWVASEVEIALEQERLRGNVIIPISLDEAFQSSDKQWVKEMKRKHIIGFKTRGQIPSYFKALSNLLKVLERKGQHVNR